MRTRKLLIALATAALVTTGATGCLHDDDDGNPSTTTLKQFVVTDLAATSDTAEPVEINDLALDTSNEDPAQYDDLLQSM